MTRIKDKCFLKLMTEEINDGLLKSMAHGDLSDKVLFVLYKETRKRKYEDEEVMDYNVRAFSLDDLTAEEYRWLIDSENKYVVDYEVINSVELFSDRMKEELTEKKRELMSDD